MLFLIQYDRPVGRIVRLERFSDDQWQWARKPSLTWKSSCSVAASEEALRKTHGRYFEDVEGLLAALAAA